MFEHVIDSYPEINKPLSAKYKKCFAYPTFKKRLPDILQGVIDEVKNKEEIKTKYGDDAFLEIDAIVEKIENLKNGMQSDKSFEVINANGKFTEEVAIYNSEIKKRQENTGNAPSWFQTEWLFAECYNYFKLHEIFYTSGHLNNYDPFLKVKTETLLASKAPVLQLCKYMVETLAKNSFTEQEKKENFVYFVKCSLWGNKADLSLSGGKPVAYNENALSQMNALDQNILVNDLEEVYNILNANEGQIIDIVLDNAGYELFNDLCLAGFLVRSGLAKKVILHGKAIPWFVSDVTPNDFHLIFDLLRNQIKSKYTAVIVEEWLNYLKNGQWVFNSEHFWITPYDFSKMFSVDRELYLNLAQNRIAIFKGDLNYRKLVGDIYWEPTTSFKTALRGFEPTNVLALRTVKADTICGLKKGVFEELTQTDPSWLITGEYALIQLLKKE